MYIIKYKVNYVKFFMYLMHTMGENQINGWTHKSE